MCEQVNKIEVGKCYKLTNGREVKVVYGPYTDGFYLAAECDKSAAYWIRENGTGYGRCGRGTVEVAWPNPRPAFAVGQIWRRPDGSSVQLVASNSPSGKWYCITVNGRYYSTVEERDFSRWEYVRTEEVT